MRRADAAAAVSAASMATPPAKVADTSVRATISPIRSACSGSTTIGSEHEHDAAPEQPAGEGVGGQRQAPAEIEPPRQQQQRVVVRPGDRAEHEREIEDEREFQHLAHACRLGARRLRGCSRRRAASPRRRIPSTAANRTCRATL